MPRIAERNLASVACAEALGFDVIVPTRIAVISAPLEYGGDRRPRVGLFMDFARGEPAAQTLLGTLRQPEVLRELTKLQLLDNLTAQVDRHSGNYFINVDPRGRARVTGIDNDQCFGYRVSDPNELSPHRPMGQSAFWGASMPPIVDTEMAKAFEELTESKLRRLLIDRLSLAEVDAAVQRLAAIKQHISELARNNMVIDPGEWDQGWVTDHLQPDNSYAGRELMSAFGAPWRHNW